MVHKKSLDEVKIIETLLHDVWKQYGVELNLSDLRKTCQKVRRRADREGIGFLTKTMPRLAKAFDKALCGYPLTAAQHGWKTMSNSELPRFLGEFFSKVLAPNGTILPNPCINSVKAIRQVLYTFYKYKLPYSAEQELSTLQKFKETDAGLQAVNERASALYRDTVGNSNWPTPSMKRGKRKSTLHRARILLARLFARFDPLDISPRNGPGAVAGKQQPWEKFLFSNVSGKITELYPRDAYFYASNGHVCDEYKNFSSWTEVDLPARVILVQKDSRGPRIISAEPMDFQWIQQGLRRVIVRLIERHPLTKWNVFFTDQSPNQRGALLGSSSGRYATLDLNEASDRVSVGLVHLLFPEHITRYLMASRSSATVLPTGENIELQKFAPMGSSLCFPIMALSIWAILTAAAPNADTRRSILVYGDDVIVPTAFAADAIEQLESCGLKVNRDKSCISGLFRESCGTDAFQGVNVTPVRFRTVWSSIPSPEVYCSFIEYSNELYKRKYFTTYDYIAGELFRVYGGIPSKDMHLACPSLCEVPVANRPRRRRSNPHLQKCEYHVWDVSAPRTSRHRPGWEMLLRFFSERVSIHSAEYVRGVQLRDRIHPCLRVECWDTQVSQRSQSSHSTQGLEDPFSGWLIIDENRYWIDTEAVSSILVAGANSDSGLTVSSYTQRHTSMLVKRWR